MKASVLINNYNYEPYVHKAISSCLGQTYKNVEIIIYDDGSTDDSLKIINSFSDKVQIISNENYGKGHCWNQINAVNLAFEKATGDIIFLLDSDDWFFKEKIERVVQAFRNDPNLVMVQHAFQLVDENDVFLNRQKRPFFSSINILKGIYFTKKLDLFFTQTSGLCFKRAFLEKILPLKEDDLSLICVDIRLSRFAAFEGKVETLQDKLGAYRIHTKNHSSNLKDRVYFQKYDNQHIDFFNVLTNAYGQPPFIQSKGLWSYIKVIILLLKSGMTLNEKRNFLISWYKSFINK